MTAPTPNRVAPGSFASVIGDAAAGSGAVAAIAGLATVGTVLAVALAARRPGGHRRAAARLGAPLGEAPPTADTDRGSSPWRRRILVAIAVAAVALVVGPVVGLLAAVVVPVAWAARRRRSRTSHRLAIERALPDAIELVVVSVHAGLTPAGAIDAGRRYVSPVVRVGFDAVHHQVGRGRALADALAELPATLGPSARELATAIAAADRDGLPLAPVLDRLAGTARAERRRHAEAAARALPVRLSFPLVVCTLPSFVLLTIVPAVLGAVSTLRGTPP